MVPRRVGLRHPVIQEVPYVAVVHEAGHPERPVGRSNLPLQVFVEDEAKPAVRRVKPQVGASSEREHAILF